MGLDMYLTKKTYVGAYFEHRNVTGTVKLAVDGKPLPIKVKQISYIDEQVGYWRKANAIHKWFVETCADGEDDCKPVHVDIKQLRELLLIVERVLGDHSLAEKLLPSTSGFFFGSTEYDEWYFDDLKDTKRILTDILKAPEEDLKYCDFEYQASW